VKPAANNRFAVRLNGDTLHNGIWSGFVTNIERTGLTEGACAAGQQNPYRNEPTIVTPFEQRGTTHTRVVEFWIGRANHNTTIGLKSRGAIVEFTPAWFDTALCKWPHDS
jgi:hypothetical protein